MMLQDWKVTYTSMALAKGEETYLKIGEGKELLIKYLEASEPDEDGYRTLMFQVNGSIRNVKILDKKLEIKDRS